jgi:error-prone DNA polymerase
VIRAELVPPRRASPAAAGGGAAGDRRAPLLREPAPDLPVESDGERVVLDYTTTGFSLGQHPLQLQALGCVDTRDIARFPVGKRVKLAGLVLMRQRPGTAKGVVCADVGARDRAALLGARLMLVEAKIERRTERAEVPITHLICTSLAKRTDLLDGLMHCGRPGCLGDMRRSAGSMKCDGQILAHAGRSGCRAAGTSIDYGRIQ